MAITDRSAAYHPLVRAVAVALRRRCGFEAGAALLVAVSGGPDSVALLRALAILAPRRGWNLRLTVAHVQHHLRTTRHAEADARFVAALARRLKLPYLRADLDPAEARGNTEAWARQARYDALVTMARTAGASFIVVAHHADDQLETILMRLIRGASLAGLSAMRWRRRISGGTSENIVVIRNAVGAAPIDRIHLIRPMLAVDRAGVEQFLADLRQSSRQDHTNRDRSRLRARLRHRVTPELRRIRPDVAMQAVRLADRLRRAAAEQARAERTAMERVKWSNTGNTDAFTTAMLDRRTARTWPATVLSGVLRRVLTKLGTPRDRIAARTLASIVRATHDTQGGTRRFALAQGVSLTLDREKLTITRRPL